MTKKLPLVPGWDAALTYDLLERHDGRRADSSGAAVFVGREDLLGSLVNAISQPDRRGTYLISGYRGAGKSSLVIEAALRAQNRLAELKYTTAEDELAPDHPRRRLRRPPNTQRPERTYRLLPLVLNVSEVSASLEPVDSGADSLPLGIDARRVLTALLRSLHQALGRLFPDPSDDERKLIADVKDAYDKARAAQFSQTAQQQAESLRSREVQSRRSVEVANLMKVLAALAGLAVIALEGVALLGTSTAAIQVVCAALAAVAVISWRTATTTQSKTSEQDSTRREVVFDNSLHQVETDLKDILSAFAEHGIRTMFVLEELDKLKDDKGEQLEAVIRYFKNLFTQAPALFFFLTDKEYFDIIDGNIAKSRYERKYALEHTFFTHRIFVTRPSLEECLDYFAHALVSKEAHKAIQVIRTTTDARVRPWGEMKPVERFLRVLLFNAQNHLFDLKSEMRGYVRVDDEGSRLEFDDGSLPEQEQALAGFHFLLEQKARLFRIGGGRDYANELLRNSLASVFSDMGDTDAHPVQALYPDADTPLTIAERAQIAGAVDSLLGDLERGGAIDVDTPTATGADAGSFHWRANAALAFAPSPKLESHEDALIEQLARASRVAAQFGERGALRSVLPDSDIDVEQLVARHAAMADEIRQAPRPLSREEADQRSAQVVKELAPLLAAARQKHQERLTARGWQLLPMRARSEGNVVIVTPASGEDRPGRILLVYGTEADLQQIVQKAVAEPTPEPIAVVLVGEEPEIGEEALDALLSGWRDALTIEADPSLVSVGMVALGEQLDADSVEEAWGERTGDELVMAGLWVAERGARIPDPATAGRTLLTSSRTQRPPRVTPTWLGMSTGPERLYESLTSAAQAWLAGPDRVLVGVNVRGLDHAIADAFVEASVRSNGPRLLVEWGLQNPVATVVPGGTGSRAVETRLRRRGRLIALHAFVEPDVDAVQADLAAPDARAVIVAARLKGGLGDVSISTVRADEFGGLGVLAELLDGQDEQRAIALFTQAAEAGDAHAMAALIGRLRRAGDQDGTERWATELIAKRAWDAVRAATRDLDDPALATRLLEAAAEAGDTQAMALLVARPGDPERSQRWEDRLFARRDWAAVRQAGADLPDNDRAVRLLEAAANEGDVEAMSHLVTASRFDDDVRDRWMPQLIAAGGRGELWSAASDLDASDPERALALHRAAADAGDTDSMLEVVVRCASTDPEASLQNQARLVEHGESRLLAQAAERLAEEDPDRAAELQALANQTAPA